MKLHGASTMSMSRDHASLSFELEARSVCRSVLVTIEGCLGSCKDPATSLMAACRTETWRAFAASRGRFKTFEIQRD